MEQIRYYNPLAPIEDLDVLVVGGGFAGVSAAIRAGRLGKKTMLVERGSCFGGIGTAGMVNAYSQFLTKETNTLTNGGLFFEYLEASRIHLGKTVYTDYFDGEWMKSYFDRQLRQAGVHILLHTTVFAAKTEAGRIVSVSAATGSGPIELRARTYVDASGDGTLAALAGCGFYQGDENGEIQATTLMNRFSGIDCDRLLPRSEMRALWRKLAPEKNLKNKAHTLHLYNIPPANTVLFNTTCLPITDPTDPFAVSAAMMDGREQIAELLTFCRKNLPGMEDAAMVASGEILGVRESRRVRCRYTLSAEDLLSAAGFDDQIARGCYGMDIHKPDGSVKMMHVPNGTFYTIPYRSLVAADLENLLIAGRCIGATHEAIGAVRIMPIAACTGEAAGAAAALAASGNGSVVTVDVSRLQETLIAGGALLCDVPCPVMEAEIC